MVEIFDLTRKKELEVYFNDIEEYYKKTLEVLGISDDLDLSLIIVGKKKIISHETIELKQTPPSCA